MVLKWLKEEIEYLKKNYPSKPFSEIKRVLRIRTKEAIQNKAYSLGLRRQIVSWSEDEKETLRKLYPCSPREEILEALERKSWSAIRKEAYRLGVKRLTEGKRLLNIKELAEYRKHLAEVQDF